VRMAGQGGREKRRESEREKGTRMSWFVSSIGDGVSRSKYVKGEVGVSVTNR
jgi:hypothetical protein